MGLIMSQFMSAADDIRLARQMGIENIVLISPWQVEDIPAVVFPGSPPGYLAARHLHERGYRHLGIVHPKDLVMEDIFQQRLEGMHAALDEIPGITLDIFPLSPTLSDACSLVDTYLTRAEYPIGIYSFNDDYALPLLRALADRGVQVPQQIALVGTNDLPACEFVRPSLTSIRYDSESAIGKRVVEMLINMQTDHSLAINHTHTLSPQLIQRESS
jgi:LacI family transcriptional regulator